MGVVFDIPIPDQDRLNQTLEDENPANLPPELYVCVRIALASLVVQAIIA